MNSPGLVEVALVSEMPKPQNSGNDAEHQDQQDSRQQEQQRDAGLCATAAVRAGAGPRGLAGLR